MLQKLYAAWSLNQPWVLYNALSIDSKNGSSPYLKTASALKAKIEFFSKLFITSKTCKSSANKVDLKINS